MANIIDEALEYQTFAEQSSVGTPDANEARVYWKTDGFPYGKNDAGTEYKLSGAILDTTNVSNPPSDAELDAALGAPSADKVGKFWLVDDNNANTNLYLVSTNGTSWFYLAMTKAT